MKITKLNTTALTLFTLISTASQGKTFRGDVTFKDMKMSTCSIEPIKGGTIKFGTSQDFIARKNGKPFEAKITAEPTIISGLFEDIVIKYRTQNSDGFMQDLSQDADKGIKNVLTGRDGKLEVQVDWSDSMITYDRPVEVKIDVTFECGN